MSFSRYNWHPFVATLQEYAAGDSTSYGDSILKNFYEIHQPAHAAAAYVAFNKAPQIYSTYPAYLYRLGPWSSKNVEEKTSNIIKWITEDLKEHAKWDESANFEKDGFQYHGPVSDRKGRLEYARLVNVYESIKKNGYDISHGFAHFILLKRGDEYRFMSYGNGNHRTAVMSALDFETIPAVFSSNFITNIDMAEYWPQVRRGIWSLEQAGAYFNYLFDFDSRI